MTNKLSELFGPICSVTVTVVLSAFSFAASVSVHAEPRLRKPKTSDVVKISNTKSISGTFDCGGKTYRWTGRGNCSQKEGMPPMFVLQKGATLKNCFIEGAPDGIHIRGNNVTIDNIVMPDVCEDAVSISKNAKLNNIKILNSQFARCDDKCLQFNPNSVKKIEITNNDFFDGERCVRFKAGADMVAKKNEFVDCGEAFRHSEGKARLEVGGNKYYGVKRQIRGTSDLKIVGKD